MKNKLLVVLTLTTALALQSVPSASAADAAAQFKELVAKAQAGLKAGKHTESDLADDLKQFDALLAEQLEKAVSKALAK